MSRPKTIQANIEAIPVMGAELVETDLKTRRKQRVRSFIQRWQDENDPDQERQFTVHKSKIGYLIIRIK